MKEDVYVVWNAKGIFTVSTSMRWYRTGELDEWDSIWHLVAELNQRSYLPTLCGAAIARGNQWAYGNESGWEWLRTHRAKLCLGCIDALPK